MWLPIPCPHTPSTYVVVYGLVLVLQEEIAIVTCGSGPNGRGQKHAHCGVQDYFLFIRRPAMVGGGSDAGLVSGCSNSNTQTLIRNLVTSSVCTASPDPPFAHPQKLEKEGLIHFSSWISPLFVFVEKGVRESTLAVMG